MWAAYFEHLYIDYQLAHISSIGTGMVKALRCTDNWSCHFHCTVLAALCGASVCFCLFLALHVVYLPIYAKLGLVVGMTKQMSNGKEADIVNC